MLVMSMNEKDLKVLKVALRHGLSYDYQGPFSKLTEKEDKKASQKIRIFFYLEIFSAI